VTQPRVTCYRAGLRIGEPRMAALLVAHRRPGFYCRVITEGEVEAGQDIVKIAAGPGQVTVAEIDALLYLPGHPRGTLERALRIPALSPGWKRSLQSVAAQAQNPAASAGNAGLTAAGPPPAWTGFRSLRVVATQDESSQVRSIYLADPDGQDLPVWLPGQCVTLRLPDDSGRATVIRNYSLSNRPGEGRYRISVKRELHGTASGIIHSRVRAGDLVDVAAPRGTFVLTDGDRPVILLSAGIGATPVLSMLHSLARAGSGRGIWWLHGARDSSEHSFAAEVRDVLAQLPNSRCHVFYSRADQGRLSAEALRRLDLPLDVDAYLCGPTAFMDDLGAALVALGVDPARVHSERFGAAPVLTPGIAATAVPPHPPGGPPGTGPEVQFARSGVSAPWGPPSTTLLEFAERCDVPTRWSCRTGVCHNCETPLLSGRVRYDPEPLDPPAAGNVLICCAHPTEAVVVDL